MGRARDLTRQLLTFAKGGLPIKKPIIVADLLQDVVPLALSGSSSAVEMLVDENVWPIEIDEDQIHQVINNIFDYAFSSAKVTVEVRMQAFKIRLNICGSQKRRLKR